MKVYPFKIPKPLNENLIVQVDLGEIFYDKLHQHEEIQISYIVKGKGKLMVSDSIHQYAPGDLFVIGGNMPHLFQSNTEIEEHSHMISLFFLKDSFGKGFFELPELEQVKGFFDKSEVGFKIKEVGEGLKRLMLKFPELSKFSRLTSFLKLLKKLCISKSEVLTSFRYHKTISNNEGQRMQLIFDYVFGNFQNEVTLEEISELAYMTPNAFCRYFKQRTNKTFFQFLIELRIEHVCQMLVENHDIPMAEVAYKSGFKSISNFNRKFKEIKGMTPTTFQKNLSVRNIP